MTDFHKTKIICCFQLSSIAALLGTALMLLPTQLRSESPPFEYAVDHCEALRMHSMRRSGYASYHYVSALQEETFEAMRVPGQEGVFRGKMLGRTNRTNLFFVDLTANGSGSYLSKYVDIARIFDAEGKEAINSKTECTWRGKEDKSDGRGGWLPLNYSYYHQTSANSDDQCSTYYTEPLHAYTVDSLVYKDSYIKIPADPRFDKFGDPNLKTLVASWGSTMQYMNFRSVRSFFNDGPTADFVISVDARPVEGRVRTVFRTLVSIPTAQCLIFQVSGDLFASMPEAKTVGVALEGVRVEKFQRKNK